MRQKLNLAQIRKSGSMPARFKRERLLIIGCGDVGLRVIKALPQRVRVVVLTSNAMRCEEFRALGVTPIVGNLDQPASLSRLAGLASRIINLAPPPLSGVKDPRTLALTRALRRRSLPKSLVYGSTSGVYGDCQGRRIKESQTISAQTPRAKRRVEAEACVRFLGRSSGVRVGVLRIPGIYANDRVGGTPKDRLLMGLPLLETGDDVYTNHIHADDLARACWIGLWRCLPQRTYNINDDSELKMGDYFDLAADLLMLPRSPRVSRSIAQEKMSLIQMSFMSESRRMDNNRMKKELRLTLAYPNVQCGLAN